MSHVQISNEHLEGALTLDQLIAELLAAKKSGLATGNERVCLGTGFLDNCWPIQSVALMPNLDGDMVVGVSAESEQDWARAMSGHRDSPLNIVDPATAGQEDPVELARRLGFDKRVSEIESERLGDAAPTPARAKGPSAL